MRLRCIRSKRRKQAAVTPPLANGSAATAATPVPTLAAIMAAEGDTAAHEQRGPRNSEAIMSAFPAGYESGNFRLVPGAVLLSAEGRPTLRIEEQEQLSI
jgi:hypothetical protein